MAQKKPLSTNKAAVYQREYKRKRHQMRKAGLLPPIVRGGNAMTREEILQMSNFKVTANLIPLKARLEEVSRMPTELTDRASAEALLDALRAFEETVKDVRIQIAFACTLFNREKLREMAREGGLDEHLEKRVNAPISVQQFTGDQAEPSQT